MASIGSRAWAILICAVLLSSCSDVPLIAGKPADYGRAEQVYLRCTAAEAERLERSGLSPHLVAQGALAECYDGLEQFRGSLRAAGFDAEQISLRSDAVQDAAYCAAIRDIRECRAAR